MPTVLVEDNFAEATGTVTLDNHTPTPTGTDWAVGEIVGATTFAITSTEDWLEATASVNNARLIYIASPSPTGADVDVELTIRTVQATQTDDPVFVVARWADASNYYSAGTYQAANTADKKIFKKVAGVVTELASGDNGIAANDVLKFELRGTTLKLYKNGIESLSVTDSALSAAGGCGVGMGSAWANAADDTHTGWNFSLFKVTEPDAVGGSVGGVPLRRGRHFQHMIIR